MMKHRIKYWFESKYLCWKGTHRLVEMYSHINGRSIGHLCVACYTKIINQNADIDSVNAERKKMGLEPWDNARKAPRSDKR